MRKSLFIFLRIYFSLIFIFVCEKIFFMLYYHSIYGNYSFREWGNVLLHGLSLDASVAGYLSVLPGLLLVASPWLGRYYKYMLLRGYFIGICGLFGVIFVSDMALYQYWGFRLDSTPLFYLASPKEAFASVGTGFLFLGLAAIMVHSLLFYALFKFFVLRYCLKSNEASPNAEPLKKRILCSLVLFVLTASLFIPIRGGFSVSTMNVGKVYFSNEMPLNHAAINPCFSLLESLLRSEDFSSLYRFMPPEEAARIFSKLVDMPVVDPLPSLFEVHRPNIVVVFLESFMASVVEPLGGERGVTPHLSRRCGEGVLFTNLYANSFRTDRGIVSVLSGYPAQPTTSIMKYPQKSQSLPSISRSLHEVGYTTRYYYGGDADFTNMRSYLMGQGIGEIISQDDFPLNYRTTNWGIPDHFLFQRAAQDLKEVQETPFFYVIQTSSSHEPFKVPSHRFKDPYRNAVHYTDSCLNQYLVELERSPYWENTVVLLVADHHYGGFEGEPRDDVERRRIPALLIGGAVRKPLRVETCASQIDLAATLLYQLNLPHDEFRFSKNILNPVSPHFAFFAYPDCAGIVSTDSTYVQDNAAGTVLAQRKNRGVLPEVKSDSVKSPSVFSVKGTISLKNATRAFLQTLYDDLGAR